MGLSSPRSWRSCTDSVLLSLVLSIVVIESTEGANGRESKIEERESRRVGQSRIKRE